MPNHLPNEGDPTVPDTDPSSPIQAQVYTASAKVLSSFGIVHLLAPKLWREEVSDDCTSIAYLQSPGVTFNHYAGSPAFTMLNVAAHVDGKIGALPNNGLMMLRFNNEGRPLVSYRIDKENITSSIGGVLDQMVSKQVLTIVNDMQDGLQKVIDIAEHDLSLYPAEVTAIGGKLLTNFGVETPQVTYQN